MIYFFIFIFIIYQVERSDWELWFRFFVSAIVGVIRKTASVCLHGMKCS